MCRLLENVQAKGMKSCYNSTTKKKVILLQNLSLFARDLQGNLMGVCINGVSRFVNLLAIRFISWFIGQIYHLIAPTYLFINQSAMYKFTYQSDYQLNDYSDLSIELISQVYMLIKKSDVSSYLSIDLSTD